MPFEDVDAFWLLWLAPCGFAVAHWASILLRRRFVKQTWLALLGYAWWCLSIALSFLADAVGLREEIDPWLRAPTGLAAGMLIVSAYPRSPRTGVGDHLMAGFAVLGAPVLAAVICWGVLPHVASQAWPLLAYPLLWWALGVWLYGKQWRADGRRGMPEGSDACP